MVRIFPKALWHVARGPQGYIIVKFTAFRYGDLRQGKVGAYLIASVRQFKLLTLSMKFNLGQIDLGIKKVVCFL